MMQLIDLMIIFLFCYICLCTVYFFKTNIFGIIKQYDMYLLFEMDENVHKNDLNIQNSDNESKGIKIIFHWVITFCILFLLMFVCVFIGASEMHLGFFDDCMLKNYAFKSSASAFIVFIFFHIFLFFLNFSNYPAG